MKCISKRRRPAAVILALALGLTMTAGGCAGTQTAVVTEYETEQYNRSLQEGSLLSEGLCVAESDVALEGYAGTEGVTSEGLFDLSGETVLYGSSIHERLYPASVTKIMTALLALENGSLEDEVTISQNAAADSFPSDASLVGLRQGEVWSLEDLLYALLLRSGNDAATAIAEYVDGTEAAFVERMNARAAELMANNTHYVNPHGLHDDNHYTTAYDIYLIFNACIQNEEFVKIIGTASHTAQYRNPDGSTGETVIEPTNWYASGAADLPSNMTVVGGKTGTTGEAGNCLVLLNETAEGNRYISVVMGAPDRPVLYKDMTAMIETVK